MSKSRQREFVGPAVLEDRQALHLVDHRPLSIQVISGAAYVTREGDSNDYIVKSGENLDIEDRGLVVIQGFPSAQFKVCA